jgi:hypothetical protein
MDPVFPDGVQDAVIVCVLAQLSEHEHEHGSTEELAVTCLPEATWVGDVAAAPWAA